MIVRNFTLLVVVATLACHSGQAGANLVIRAEQAAIRTAGGPYAGGGWNLWSNGRVGQPLRFATAGTYAIVVRAWGSPAAGVFPELALLVDGKVVQTATVGRRPPEDHRFDVELAAGIRTRSSRGAEITGSA